MDQALGNLDNYGKVSKKRNHSMLINANQLDVFCVRMNPRTQDFLSYSYEIVFQVSVLHRLV